jgi:hypothetical protein
MCALCTNSGSMHAAFVFGSHAGTLERRRIDNAADKVIEKLHHYLGAHTRERKLRHRSLNLLYVGLILILGARAAYRVAI